MVDAASLAEPLARCPFCKETFPVHIVTEHCNYCVDAVGFEEEVKRVQSKCTDGSSAEVGKAVKAGYGGITGTLRTMVSQKKCRFQEDGFDLDLTYITPRIIAMGFPSYGTEGYYRNPVDEVERFFETRHKGHYRIYNLCSERVYDRADRFGGSFRRFPFDDHNAPAPIALIPQLCADAQEWLSQDPQNVLAVHCKAGKGRTGVMVAAYLMFSNTSLRRADDALLMFGNTRTHDGKGVTIPSQIRYVGYWEQMLSAHSGRVPTPKTLKLKKLVVRSAIKYSKVVDPWFLVLDGPSKEELFDSRKRTLTKQTQHAWGCEWEVIATGDEASFSGDIKFIFHAAKGVLFHSASHLFHFWLHTAFAPLYVQLDKMNLDKACKDEKHETYREDLSVEVYFEDLGRPYSATGHVSV